VKISAGVNGGSPFSPAGSASGVNSTSCTT